MLEVNEKKTDRSKARRNDSRKSEGKKGGKKRQKERYIILAIFHEIISCWMWNLKVISIYSHEINEMEQKVQY